MWRRGPPRFPSKAKTQRRRRSGRNLASRIWSKEVCARPATSCASQPDPPVALAWAGLSETHLWYCSFSTQGLADFDAHLAKAREAAGRALAIEPNLPEALRVRAETQLNFDFDWKGAGETLRGALALAPADPALLIDAGTLAAAKGDMT